MIKRIMAFIIASFITSINVLGQAGIVVTGQSVENGSGKISASIGQVDYNNTSAVSGSVNEGIQQSNIITVEIIELDSLIIKVYPNPTQDAVYVDFVSLVKPVHYSLLSTDGKMVMTNTSLNDMHNTISLSNLAQGIYYLQLFQGQALKFTHKIIKQ
jgi:hypothetical protein